MKYSELRKEIESGLGNVTNHREYYRNYLSEDFRSKMDALENRHLYHLFSDLTSMDIDKDLQTYLGASIYTNSEEYARDCIQTAFLVNSIYGLRIRGWTASALSCFDNFLLVYIGRDLNEKIKSYSGIKDERWKYRHLMEKGGEDAEIGTCFDTIYQQRNDLFHVEIVDVNGLRKQRPVRSSTLRKVKEIILENFEKSLKLIVKKIP